MVRENRGSPSGCTALNRDYVAREGASNSASEV